MKFDLRCQNFLFPLTSFWVVIRFTSSFFGTICNLNRGITANSYKFFNFLVKNILQFGAWAIWNSIYVVSIYVVKFLFPLFGGNQPFLGTICNTNRRITVNAYNFFNVLVKNLLLCTMSIMKFDLRRQNFLFPLTSFCVIIRFTSPFFGTMCNINRGITANTYKFFNFLVKNILQFGAWALWNSIYVVSIYVVKFFVPFNVNLELFLE